MPLPRPPSLIARLGMTCAWRAMQAADVLAMHAGGQRWSAAGAHRLGAAAAVRHLASTSDDAVRRQAEIVMDELRGLGGNMEVFDRPLKWAQRERAAHVRAARPAPDDPLLSQVADRLLDRLDDCVAKFPTAVVLGGAADHVLERLACSRAGVERIICVDGSEAMLNLAQQRMEQLREQAGEGGAGRLPELHCVLADEESLPLAPGSVDVVVSCLGLHWANDLPGVMAQCRIALKPDGLFVAAMLGGDTLQKELRIACSVAQQEREGGVSPFVSPLAQVRDAGNLLTRAQLALPTVDVDEFVMRYASPLDLVAHLRAMGESNALLAKRQGALRRGTALAAVAAYQAMFGEPGGDGSVPATFQIIYMTGWSPSPTQPKAQPRGSATISFEEFAAEIEGRAPAAAGGGGGAAGPPPGRDGDASSR